MTFQGSPVAPIARTAQGKAVCVYLDRFGEPTTHTTDAWPHDLIGRHWHLADVKRLVALLPLSPQAGSVPPAAADPCPQKLQRRVGGPLFVHRVAEALDREDQP